MSQPYQRGAPNTNMAKRGTPSPYGASQSAEEVNRTMLEQENDLRWMELGDQVSLLKSMTEDINQEVKSQNSLLDGMGSNMSSASELFAGTIGKLSEMLTNSSSGHMYYLMFFVIFVFLLIYFMMGR
mmetsp:Transcript_9518/g.15856  ORF Transcript_9518/g.15856 Transcript_9518/m.15856 type:complete len:127 (+) Transcript_9518:36-416(+)